MALDPVNPKALKGKFKDSKDKDIDNDGDTDSSDEYLHKRRQAVSKAIGKKVEEAKMTPEQMKKALDAAKAQPKDKVSLKKPPFKMDEAAKTDDHWVHINHAGSSHSPTKDKIVGYSRPSKDAPKLKDGANGAMRVGTAKKKGYTISETFDLDEAKLPAHIIRGDKYDGVPDGIVAQAKDTVKKMNLDRSDKKQEAMYKALSDLGWEMTAAGKFVKESVVLKSLRRITEAKDAYTVAHKSFSSAVQHAEEVTKKRGFEIDPEEWDRKVSMGPRKPGSGKTNSYKIDLMKDGKDVKQKLNMQVYYDEGRYELNMYIS